FGAARAHDRKAARLDVVGLGLGREQHPHLLAVLALEPDDLGAFRRRVVRDEDKVLRLVFLPASVGAVAPDPTSGRSEAWRRSAAVSWRHSCRRALSACPT